MITETAIKGVTTAIAAVMATVSGGAVLAAVENATEAAGVEKHLTLATAAVISVVALFGALKWAIGLIIKGKDSHIEALRDREKKERERADKAEQRERDLLEELAREKTLRLPSQPSDRESRRHG